MMATDVAAKTVLEVHVRENVVALLSAVFGNLSSAEPLWPLSPATLRKRFSLLQASLGLGLQTKPGGMLWRQPQNKMTRSGI